MWLSLSVLLLLLLLVLLPLLLFLRFLCSGHVDLPRPEDALLLLLESVEELLASVEDVRVSGVNLSGDTLGRRSIDLPAQSTLSNEAGSQATESQRRSYGVLRRKAASEAANAKEMCRHPPPHTGHPVRTSCGSLVGPSFISLRTTAGQPDVQSTTT